MHGNKLSGRTREWFDESTTQVPIGGPDVFAWAALADTVADIAQVTSSCVFFLLL